jgi:ectoine hydroxylase-related dioxygenase (phytanoyl-CoA dioxygenase family)
VPGSHTWEEGRQPEPREITQAAMPAGSVLLYAASLLHGGGANATRRARTGIAIGYCLGWLRQSENQYLSYPPEVARDFPEELQALIGYCMHRPNLGWVHGHDPMHLIRGTDTSGMGAEDFLTDEQTRLMEQYHQDVSLALTSPDLKAA